MKFKRKILSFLLVVPLLLILIPFNSASAYDDGFLNGKTMNIGKTVNETLGTTTKVTDNDQSTFETVNNSNSNFVWYEFDEPISFKSFKLLAQESSFWRIAAYDSYGNRIWYVDNPVKDGSQQNVEEVKNVKKIAIERTLSNASLYEFDIFGVVVEPPEPSRETGLLYGKTSVSGVITNAITDGDNSTTQYYSWNSSTFDLGADYTINKGYFAPRNNDTFVRFLDKDKKTLSTINPAVPLNPGGVWNTLPTVENVRYIQIGHNAGSSKPTIGEFDVNGTLFVPDTTPPSVPTNLNLTSDTDSIQATWKDSSSEDLDHYELYLNDELKEGMLKEHSYSIQGLEEGTEYTVKVVAVDTSGNKSQSVSKTIKTLVTDITPPEEITELKLAATTNTIEANWTGSSSEDLDHYEVYVNGELRTGTLKGNSFLINGLSEGTEYTVKVVAVDTSGNKSEGISKAAKTKPPQIVGAEYEELPNGDYKVTWDEPTSGTVIINVGDKEFEVPASGGEFIIPKDDMEYTGLGEPDITLTPVAENGVKGEVTENPKLPELKTPFNVVELLKSGNALLWFISPFVILALAFLLVPKLRKLIVSSISKKSGEADQTGRRFQLDDTKGNNDSEKQVRQEKRQQHIGKSYLKKMEKLEKKEAEKQERQAKRQKPIVEAARGREPRTPRLRVSNIDREPRQPRQSRISNREPRTPRLRVSNIDREPRQPRQSRISNREPRTPRRER